MTQIPPLVGLTGLAGSGKSTAANWFVRNYSQAVKVAFASPIKRMAYELIRGSLPKTWHIKPMEYLEDPALKNEPIPFLGGHTGRHLMQTLGTEWGRESIHPDFWVAIAAGKVERMLGVSFKKSENIGVKVLFDDVRFANEAEMIRAYDGVVVRIVRPDNPYTLEGAHESEKMDFAVDATLVNEGTIEDLHAKLEAMFPPPAKP